ncbi:YggS family pyridoxal phosphate-dependent enzyme [filamentous cyanobacterium LEGE 11480]|uniref:Pyridoxal phosphate homeostasis protein n=2 Tax=Romeriopsis TaxID=2992131 RepID=A0A928VMF2_9CYAN|nr:YggS family pyridoxal phosphate-dependent enzyme [Romeriopsis navalis LEGE 11480]
MLEHWSQQIASFRQTIPEHVRIIAVTKKKSVTAIEAAAAAGVYDIGESQVQEAMQKHRQISDHLPNLNWHLIGRLQSNKVRKALAIFDWIHSVDSLKLAQTIDRISQELDRAPPQLCLQVKLEADPQKTGWASEALIEQLPLLDRLEHVEIRGLMVIPPFGLDNAKTQAIFQAAKSLQTTIQSQAWQHLRMDQLSMGMSNDYQAAIAQGATMIRPGRVLFGDRDH